MKEQSKEAKLFEMIESVDDHTLKPIPIDKQKPRMGQAGWSDWVLGHLNEDERDRTNNLPKTDGLQRLIPLLLGYIIRSESEITHLVPVSEREYMAVAKHTLVIQWPDNTERTFVGVGDASIYNADKPFCKYPGPIASSRARGRAYRDALMLKTCTAEEISNVANQSAREEPEDAIPASDAQRKAIETMCKKMKIDCQKFIKLGSFPHKSIDDVLAGTAKKMISVLNGFQNGTEIPPEILRES